MQVPWWFVPVYGTAGVVVVMGFLRLLTSWIDWCDRHRVPDSVCMAGAFVAVSMMMFGLAYMMQCLALAVAGR